MGHRGTKGWLPSANRETAWVTYDPSQAADATCMLRYHGGGEAACRLGGGVLLAAGAVNTAHSRRCSACF